MKFRGTMVLGAVLGLLCLGYWLMQQREEAQVREKLEAQRLFQFEGEDVARLRIAQAGKTPTEGVRADGAWKITAPAPDIEPYPPLWDRVAGRLAQLHNKRTIVEHAQDLQQYGLAEPVLQVTAELDSGEEVHLDFGALEPMRVCRYARQGDTVFLVHKDMFFELNRSLKDLRHQFLVDNRDADILRIEFARIWTGKNTAEAQAMDTTPEVGEESVRVVAERDSAGQPWRLVEPVEAQADQERVNNLVSEVRYGTAIRFIDNPASLADYGLEKPHARITVFDAEDSGPQTLFLGQLDQVGEEGGLFARREGRQSVMLIDPHLVMLLPKAPSAFRERHLMTRPATELARVRYQRGGEEFLLQEDPAEGWMLIYPKLADTDQVAVSQFIAMLKQIEGAYFPDGELEDYGLDKPEVTITLEYQDQSPPAEIRVQPLEAPENLVAATQDTGEIVQIFENYAEPLFVDSSHFRSPELLTFEDTWATKLSIVFEGIPYVFEKVDTIWLVRKPERMQLASQSGLKALLKAFRSVKGSAVTEPASDPAEYGLDTPLLAFEVLVEPPPEMREDADAGAQTHYGPLKVGAITPQNSQRRYAAVEGRDGVFRVRQALIEVVRETLKDLEKR